MRSTRNGWGWILVIGAVSIVGLWSAGDPWTGRVLRAATAQQATAPTHASPIAITSDNSEVWSVNPDNNSVSVFNVAGDANLRVAEVAVGVEPWCVAITPNNAKVYVTNMASGDVKVIDRTSRAVLKTIKVGTEPFGCALSPDGTKLYVANQSSDDVSLINTSTDAVVKNIRPVGPKPRGIAVSADGTKIYVTQFLSQSPLDKCQPTPPTPAPPCEARPRTESEGADDGRVGRVTVLDGVGNRPIGVITLSAFAVSNFFLADGDTLGREPQTNVFDNLTKAFPNLLESVVMRGSRAYVVGTCASPNGRFRFNVNVQSCVSTIDTTTDTEIKTVNLNDGVNFEVAGQTKLFNTNPFTIEFKHSAVEGFVAVAATNRLLRVTLDGQGLPTINAPTAALTPGQASPIIRIQLRDPNDPTDVVDTQDQAGGKNPRGIVINSTDTRAYAMDFLSRDVAVVDISGADPTKYKTLIRMPSAALPSVGVDAIVQRGKYLFNTAIGPVGTQSNSIRPAGLMSDTGWGSCYGCHPQALADSVTWMFPDGPRQSISMESTFPFGQAMIQNGAPNVPVSHMRVLNWSAIRDEVQDFERNIRAVSGGGGLIRTAGVPEGVAGLTQIPDLLVTANTGRDPDLDAIATYLALGVRAPISPVSADSVKKGRALFQAAGCQNCHGGPNWTSSAVNFTPPPDGATGSQKVSNAQLVAFLCRVGTFDPNLFTNGKGNEIQANNATGNVQARGVDGFNVPSLIAVFNSAPYLHSGAAPTLDAVLENQTHRKAGTGADTLADARDRKAVVKFLQSIDRTTAPFTPGVPPAGICGAP